MINFARVRHKILIFAAFILVAGVAIYGSVRNNEQIDQLKARGETYNVGVATVTPENGKDGESAYEIAKRVQGFNGTEQEWLASLVAKPENGLNAYQLAVIHGFTGSLTEWLASLKGAPGENGQPGTNGTNGADGLNGLNGADGKDGVNGADGQPGANGRTPEYTCRDNTAMWKYTDEDETAWRPWFTVISCSQPPNEPVS